MIKYGIKGIERRAIEMRFVKSYGRFQCQHWSYLNLVVLFIS